MIYRKDIQILRGISVLLVVLFHLELGDISSGFLGVDVFFVISGFLMAILYDKDNKHAFFLKRAKRLLPAYYATILITLVAAMFLTTPNEFGPVVKQSTIAVFFSSNIGFWFENSYFSKSAFNPLLHLWSLGVEIQFYFLIPLLFWGLRKNKAALPTLFILSLLACFYITGISPKTSFFMMPLRLWEFLIGISVAIYFTNNGKITYTNSSWLGLAALIFIIGIPMMKVDGEALGFLTGHPGIWALIVTLSTGMVLALGLPKFIENSGISSILEVTGKYSYSIYLVHFPVIVLFAYKPFSGTILKVNGFAQSSLLIGIMVVLSILMYRFIEAPAHFSRKPGRWLLASPIIILIFSWMSPAVQQLNFTEKEMLIFDAWSDRSAYRCGKINRIVSPTAISCETTRNVGPPFKKALLVGNSHADSIKSTFSSVAEQLNIGARFMVPNDPLLRGGITPKNVINEALSKNITLIVLHYSPGSIELSVLRELNSLAKINHIDLAFIMPVPTWDRHIPSALWENIRLDKAVPVQSLAMYKDKTSEFYTGLLNLASEDFKIYSLGHIFCQNNCLLVSDSGKPFYFDKHHLTLTGSDLLRDLFKNVLTDD